MSVYSVELEWYNEDIDDFTKPNENYFFDNAEDALDFAHDVSWKKSVYEEFGSPMGVFVFKIKNGKAYNLNEGFGHYQTAFWDLDKKHWMLEFYFNDLED